MARLMLAIIILIIGQWLLRMLNRWVARMMLKREFCPSVRTFLRNRLSVVLKALLVIRLIQVVGFAMTLPTAKLNEAITRSLKEMKQKHSMSPAHRIGVSRLEADSYNVIIDTWIPAIEFENGRLIINERLMDELRNNGFLSFSKPVLGPRGQQEALPPLFLRKCGKSGVSSPLNLLFNTIYNEQQINRNR